MATIEELNNLYQDTKHRELIAAVEKEQLNLAIPRDAEKALLKAWSHHQLGDYPSSVHLMEVLCKLYPPSSKIGESARRGRAYGLLQSGGDFSKIEEIIQEIPPSLDLDNLYMNRVLVRAREGQRVPAQNVISKILAVLEAVPYKTIHGHIINNGTLALYEAREQPGVRWYLPILPGLIDTAIGIYEATATPKNHIADALFQASQIFEAAGWREAAINVGQQSGKLWRELVASQGGERYQCNLDGALAQLEKLKRLTR